jgi:hypothetical protein
MKNQARVRQRLTQTQRSKILEAYQESGLTQREFSRQRGIGMSTLQLRLRKASLAAHPERSGFVPRRFNPEEAAGTTDFSALQIHFKRQHC